MLPTLGEACINHILLEMALPPVCPQQEKLGSVVHYGEEALDLQQPELIWRTIMLSEMSQTQEEKHCMITPTCDSTKVEYIGAEGRMVVTRGGEVRDGEMAVKGFNVAVL